MRTLAKNKRKMYYALLNADVPIYEYDEEGNIKYITVDGEQIPVTTGQKAGGYSTPVEFMGNIALSGESDATEFGVDIGDYDAILVVPVTIPITETSLIWFQSEVEYADASETSPKPQSADFTVKSVKPSINSLKAVLKRITK